MKSELQNDIHIDYYYQYVMCRKIYESYNYIIQWSVLKIRYLVFYTMVQYKE